MYVTVWEIRANGVSRVFATKTKDAKKALELYEQDYNQDKGFDDLDLEVESIQRINAIEVLGEDEVK